MAKGVPHVNEVPQKFRCRLRHSNAITVPLGTGATAISIIRLCYGVTYSAGIHGIEIKIVSTESVLGVVSYTVTLTTPWGTYTLTDLSLPADIDYILEIDGLRLTVGAGCGWDLTFDELRLLDGTDTVVKTIAGDLDFGTGFDRRKDDWYQSSNTSLTTSPPDCSTDAIECPETEADVVESTRLNELVTLGGWQLWSEDDSMWVSDDVSEKYQSGTQTCAPCTPDGAPATIGAEESWDITTRSNCNDVVTGGLGDIVTCVCVATSLECDYQTFYIQSDSDRSGLVEAHVIPKDSEIFDHHRITTLICNGSETEVEETVTETETFMLVNFSATKQQVIVWCDYLLGEICPCPTPEEGGEPVFVCGDFPVSTACCSTLTVAMDWPTAISCGSAGVAYGLSRNWRHGRALLAGDLIELGFSVNSDLNFSSIITATEAESLDAEYGQGTLGDPFWLIYVHDSEVFLGKVESETEDITMAENLGAGDYGTLCFARNNTLFTYRLALDGSDYKLYGRAWDSNLQAIEAEWDVTGLVAGIENAPITARVTIQGNTLKVVLMYRAAGDQQLAISSNGKVFT